MPVSIFNAIAQSSAQQLLNSTFEGILLAFVAWLLLRLLPRQNAGTRFGIWMAVLLSIATLPLVEALAHLDRSAVPSSSHASLILPADWGTALFLTWAVIAAVLLFRVAFGVLHLRRLRNSAEEVDLVSLDPLPRQTIADFQQHRAVRLRVSDEVYVPTAVGLFRPAVLLPRWVLAELSAGDLNSVLIHELAHLRRRDDWTNLLQKLLRAVFFFHPAVWWIEKRLSLEREMACDEHVLATSSNPRAYAECLVSLAEKGFLRRAVMLAQGAVNRARECSTRVAQIINGNRPQTARTSRLTLVAAASGSILLLATFAQAPNLVAFGKPDPQTYARHAKAKLVEDATFGVTVTEAAWHPGSQITSAIAPAGYVGSRTAAKQVSKPKRSRTTNPVAVQRTATIRKSAPLMHRASLRPLAPYAISGTLVIVRETDFYSNGWQVWAISIYRMAVLKTPPAISSEISRKAI